MNFKNNYKILSESIEYYESKGFKYIEVPWTVSREIDDSTRPEYSIPYELKHNNKRLIGSGEQSFLYLQVKGYLNEGYFQSITPCFRDDSYSIYHKKQFIKNELYINKNVNKSTLDEVIITCKEFFKQYIPKVNVIQTPYGYDIVDGNNVELGSYGIRERNGFEWIYATGCAMPRFQIVMNGIS